MLITITVFIVDGADTKACKYCSLPHEIVCLKLTVGI
jgi:hypothetical protein